jgi:predicted component of type VI protein secretion system
MKKAFEFVSGETVPSGDIPESCGGGRGGNGEGVTAMRVVLVVSSGKSNVREVILGDDTVIGRSSECKLKVASTEVSRKHCRIRVRGPQVLISDLGSSNGTFLNGKALPPQTEVVVPPRSKIVIGPLEFHLEYDPASPGPGESGRLSSEGHTVVDRVPAKPAQSTDGGVGAVAAAMGAARGALTAGSDGSASGKPVEGRPPESTLFDLALESPDDAAIEAAAQGASGTGERPNPRAGWGLPGLFGKKAASLSNPSLSNQETAEMVRPVVPTAVKEPVVETTGAAGQPVSGALELPLFPEEEFLEMSPLVPAATASTAPAKTTVASTAAGAESSDFDAALQDFLKGL